MTLSLDAVTTTRPGAIRGTAGTAAVAAIAPSAIKIASDLATVDVRRVGLDDVLFEKLDVGFAGGLAEHARIRSRVGVERERGLVAGNEVDRPRGEVGADEHDLHVRRALGLDRFLDLLESLLDQVAEQRFLQHVR